MSDSKLAIVIPAFKALYFDQTLASIAEQSDTRFTLYIGDDASPDDLLSIVEKYKNKINIAYKRFPQNVGGKSLVNQWRRCVELANEEWIWLFGDDDLMPKDAVSAFYSFLESNPNFDIARFNLAIIDGKGESIHKTTNHPYRESSSQFANRVLDRSCSSSASEYIFSRNVYQETGGFIDFPLGWASDTATWIMFGMEKGIYTIGGEPVRWRLSGHNLSSRNDGRTWILKIRGCIEFTRFVRQRLDVQEDKLFDWMFFHFSLLTQGAKKVDKTRMHIKFISKVIASNSVSLPVVLKFYKERKLMYFKRKLFASN